MAIVYQTYSFADATLKVHIAATLEQADLAVCQVALRGGAASDALWYTTANRHEASSRIFVCAKAMADLSIFFVKSRAEARWLAPHRLKNRL